MRESTIRKLAGYFLILWLLAAIGLTATNIRIHEIRSPEIYDLTGTMNTLLDKAPSRQGLFVRVGEPDWDYIAKTSWYWRSDIRLVPDFDSAVELLRKDNFKYILAQIKDRLTPADIEKYSLKLYAENEKLLIYIPADSAGHLDGKVSAGFAD